MYDAVGRSSVERALRCLMLLVSRVWGPLHARRLGSAVALWDQTRPGSDSRVHGGDARACKRVHFESHRCLCAAKSDPFSLCSRRNNGLRRHVQSDGARPLHVPCERWRLSNSGMLVAVVCCCTSSTYRLKLCHWHLLACSSSLYTAACAIHVASRIPKMLCTHREPLDVSLARSGDSWVFSQ